MKKITLMTSSILALGIVGISTSATNISAASTSHQTSISNSVDMRDNFEDIILDKGEFSSPLTLEKYDYEEKVVITTEYEIFKCFEEYIEKGKLTKTPNTIKGQITVKNYLELFCKEKTKKYFNMKT